MSLTKDPSILKKTFVLQKPLEGMECWNRTRGETGQFEVGEKVYIDQVSDRTHMVVYVPDDDQTDSKAVPKSLKEKDGRPATGVGYRFIVENSKLCDAIGIPDIGPQFDLVGDILRYEYDEMTAEEIKEFFQYLIDNDLAYRLQGHYGRTANTLIAAGHCKPRFDTPEEPAQDMTGY